MIPNYHSMLKRTGPTSTIFAWIGIYYIIFFKNMWNL